MCSSDLGQLLDYAENTDCFVLINAKDNRSLGEYYLNDSGRFVVPDPWKPAIDTDRLGSFIEMCIRDRANEDKETAVHFRNQVDDADLQALLEHGKKEPEVCTCTAKCQAGVAWS